jgi:hypothetical protein
VSKEDELPSTRLAVSRDDPVADPGPDDLLVRVQQLGELFGIKDGRHADRRGPPFESAVGHICGVFHGVTR